MNEDVGMQFIILYVNLKIKLKLKGYDLYGGYIILLKLYILENKKLVYLFFQ